MVGERKQRIAIRAVEKLNRSKGEYQASLRCQLFINYMGELYCRDTYLFQLCCWLPNPAISHQPIYLKIQIFHCAVYLSFNSKPSGFFIIICKIIFFLIWRGDQAHTMRRSARLIKTQMGGVKKHAQEGVVKASEA